MMKLYRLLFLFMPIQSICMDYKEGTESEVYVFINENEKITATRFKKQDTFLVIKKDSNNRIVGQAKDPQRVFRKLELCYGELTDSQSDYE